MMYRRIELILRIDPICHFIEADGTNASSIHGLCGYGNNAVVDAWIRLHNPRKEINKNVRFYFTEAG